ncbi:hypothetical protein CBF29_02735 [Vagococcus elongatus]|uniref:Uncharacterized protein n=2 Tax=Vagococcus elongatus TaxID=180344 RepID=A0A430B4L9_9ENTE|nr:hypothetical protein CBF29_02735 [Vagococcus elongatus]
MANPMSEPNTGLSSTISNIKAIEIPEAALVETMRIVFHLKHSFMTKTAYNEAITLKKSG